MLLAVEIGVIYQSNANISTRPNFLFCSVSSIKKIHKSVKLIELKHEYRLSHNLWQFPGNCLQIANYVTYSNFEAIFEMPCLLTSRKVQNSAPRVFLVALKKSKLNTLFWVECVIFCTFLNVKRQFISKMSSKLLFLS